MLATAYDVQNELLVGQDDCTESHRFKRSIWSNSTVSYDDNGWVDVYCECGWIKTVKRGEAISAWEEHVDEAVAGC